MKRCWIAPPTSSLSYGDLDTRNGNSKIVLPASTCMIDTIILWHFGHSFSIIAPLGRLLCHSGPYLKTVA